ncbi:MAG: tetratricopeptide repeat protein [Scytonema hyalinum WJT4-NPBG1]|jgi:CHAT domain-containing protein/tetratricopeptide (TPR) repeat protein|nr:tetratricopeptide repeat protein [Scytonema hyalinum WJT4-NPBG1]
MHLSHLTRFGAIALTLLCLLNPAYGASSHSNFVRYFFGTLQAQKPESLKTEADRLYDQGVDQYESGQFQKSLETYQKVLAIYQQIGGRDDIAKTLYAIGVIYNQTSQYYQARDVLKEALVIYQEIGDKEGIGDTLNSLGAISKNLGQYPQALKFYQQALAISRKVDVGIPNKETQETAALILNNIGLVYQSMGQYSQALEYYQQSLTVKQKIEDKLGVGHSLNSIGGVYYETGQYSQALKFFQQALANVQNAKEPTDKANILNNIGLVYSELGQYSKALKFYQQALAIREKIGDQDGEGTILNNIGFTYNQMKKYSQALNYYQKAVAAFKKIGNQPKMGSTLNNIGFAYQQLGQYSQAIESLQQGLRILQEVGDRAVAGRTFDSMGSAYKGIGNYSQALASYQQALFLSREVGDKPAERITLGNIGDLLARQNKPQLAIIFYKQSVNVTEAIRAELRSLPREQQQSYTATIADTYRRLADLLLQQDRVLEAQQVLDLLKIQELDDYLRDVRGNERTAKGVESLSPEQSINQGLKVVADRQIKISRQLGELQKIPSTNRKPDQIAKIVELEANLITDFNQFIDSPEVNAWLEQLSSKAAQQIIPLENLNSLRDNLQRLNQNAVLLYPLILDDRLELVLTSPNTPPIHRSVSVKKEELNRAIVDFRRALENPESDATVPAQKLYEYLIKPIEKDLANADAKTIIYAPDGPLRYIPLAALYDGKKWLAQRFRTNNITALSLTELDTQPLPQIKVLAGATTQRHIVQVESTSLPFKALEYAGAEVNNLATMMPGTKTLLDNDFNREAMISYLNVYPIIHMATHAKFVNGKPEYSFILMGDGGLITLPDIQKLSLPNIDLVVLSACETAVGDQIGKGEEILGFGYQIQRTGARAAIASLWSVSDGGTQALMNAFYAFLSQGKITKAEALRQAQAAMITSDYSGITQDQDRGILKSTREKLPAKVANRLSHPYYWAPFILIGNGL